MNAGGHGSDMSSVLVTATTLDLATGVVRVRPADGLALESAASDRPLRPGAALAQPQ
jgi:hypothetical protein